MHCLAQAPSTGKARARKLHSLPAESGPVRSIDEPRAQGSLRRELVVVRKWWTTPPGEEQQTGTPRRPSEKHSGQAPCVESEMHGKRPACDSGRGRGRRLVLSVKSHRYCPRLRFEKGH